MQGFGGAQISFRVYGFTVSGLGLRDQGLGFFVRTWGLV